jgi:hypothetical protein
MAGDGTQNRRYQNHGCLRKTVDDLAAGPSVRGSDELTDLRWEGSLTQILQGHRLQHNSKAGPYGNPHIPQ